VKAEFYLEKISESCLDVQWQYGNPLGRMHSNDKISSTELDSLGGSQKLLRKSKCV
jgi:hypothetical protein